METLFVLIAEWSVIGGDDFCEETGGNECSEDKKCCHHAAQTSSRYAAVHPHQIKGEFKQDTLLCSNSGHSMDIMRQME